MNLRLTLAQFEEHNSKLKNYLIDVNVVFVGMLLLLIRICAQSYNAYGVTLVWWPSTTAQKCQCPFVPVTPLRLFCR